MMIECTYDLGDILYLITDPDQRERMVSAVIVRERGVCYELSCGSQSSWHSGMECSAQKDVLKTTTN
jgi:hypothetical protein